MSSSAERTPKQYDVIVVGSGNGACGFLSHYLEHASEQANVLVLERGHHFDVTRTISTREHWSKSYSRGSIFKLHNASTPDGRLILSGGACSMGGGGSINYTMIHESSSWLSKHLGCEEAYWNHLKRVLNEKFRRDDPSKHETPLTTHILRAGAARHFQLRHDRIAGIPSHNEDETKQLHQFVSPFDAEGERTNSGVSIVDWSDERLDLELNTEVLGFELEEHDGEATCVSVHVGRKRSKKPERRLLKRGGKVILCGGAATPRLLMPYRKRLQNEAIGKHVNDHIIMPLGLYVPPPDLPVSSDDVYCPVFATKTWTPAGADGEPRVVSLDFFAGPMQKLLYMVSPFYFAFLLPNSVKRMVWRTPWLFSLFKHAMRMLVSLVNALVTLCTLGNAPRFITAMVKYNPEKEGQYEDSEDGRITLRWFEGDGDDAVARALIAEEGLPFLEKLGQKPSWLVQRLCRLATKVPFDPRQIAKFVESYSAKSLLSQQHLSGGCLFGRAVDAGESDGSRTGQVKGSSNMHVADLSAVPLPRVSPQMTAYLVGMHVAKQLYPPSSTAC